MRDLIKQVKRFMHLILLSFCVLFPPRLSAQTLTLDQANALARQNYPLIRQKDLIRQTADITIGNLSKAYLPQISLSGQASYQSDVTTVNIPIPGIVIQPLDKDQYKIIVADLNQVIYDGGLTGEQKQIQRLNAEVEDQKLEVELYKLQERVNQVYLSVLYTDAQIKQ